MSFHHSDRDSLRAPYSQSDRLIARVLVRPVLRFAHTEVASASLLAAAAVIALVWANSPWHDSYEQLLHTEFGLTLGGLDLTLDLHHWVNDLLMALFFFVVGLEIKRELVHGELRDPRAAALPVIAAVGGLLVPAGLYLLLAGGTAPSGWGVPMATDIAFALGALALVGRGLPPSLTVFLLSLAVADDLAAIAVIAVFYSQGVQAVWLLVAAVSLLVAVAMNRAGVRWLAPYVLLAGLTWLATFQSGVHATVAGVALGLITPSRPFHRPVSAVPVLRKQLDAVVGRMPEDTEDVDEHELLEVARTARETVSPLARLETLLHPWSAFVVLPLFALANAGVRVVDAQAAELLRQPVTMGVLLGLVVGKPLGIFAAAWLAVRLRLGTLPAGASWPHVAGVGALAGIGFTVALFIAELAFTDAELIDAAKVGILAASVVAGLLGALMLRLSRRATPQEGLRGSTG